MKPKLLIHAGAVYARMDRQEAVPVPEDYKGRVYYHGVSYEDVAKKILQEGKLKPNKNKADYSDMASMDPMRDQVYFSPSLGYVLSYVIGCHYDCDPEYLTMHGRYGYLFVIPAAALEDIVPDEDALGRSGSYPSLKNWLMKTNKSLSKLYNVS